VVKIVWRLPRVEVAGHISLRRPRPTESCRADVDDDDDDDDIFHPEGFWPFYIKIPVYWTIAF